MMYVNGNTDKSSVKPLLTGQNINFILGFSNSIKPIALCSSTAMQEAPARDFCIAVTLHYAAMSL